MSRPSEPFLCPQTPFLPPISPPGLPEGLWPPFSSFNSKSLVPSPPTLTLTPNRTLEEILHKLVQLIQEEDCVSDRLGGNCGRAVWRPALTSMRPLSPCSRYPWQTPG